MKHDTKLGIGLAAFIAVGLAWSATFDKPPPASPQQNAAAAQAKTRARLTQLDPAKRHDVDYAALDARFKRMAARPNMVGMAVGIVEQGRITFLSGYGETLAGSGEAVTPDTVFRWASVSKGVASTMVAKLAEQGKLSLDQPVATLAPSLQLPNGAQTRATVADVLSHRLGLYRNAFDNKLEEGQSASFLRRNLFTLSGLCAPGTCWSYQNVAFDAATEVVEKASGRPYAEELRRQLFDPIGMTSASATRAGLQSAPSWARGHTVGRRPIEVNDVYYGVPAAGGVNSNIKDMSLWMLAQMGEMPAVLSPQLLQTIQAPRVPTPNQRGRMRKFLERLADPHYGLGWRSYTYAGNRIVGHRGGVNGYRSLILFDPVRKSGVVALWNSNTSQPGGLEFEVMDMVYRLPFRDWMELDKSPAAVTPSPAIVAIEVTGGQP
ncbi:MAG: beta-lactamase family protein [Pseudomonadota bacterium]|nr:beta-lactamase family protein [Pseudomonadota bacterium]